MTVIRIIICVCFCLISFKLGAQCSAKRDTLVYENFEMGLPASWESDENTTNRRWKVDQEGFGNFKSPGTGKWIYIDDEGEDASEAGILLSPFIDLSHLDTNVELSFQLNFQEFDHHGNFKVEMLSEDEWVLIFETVEDLEAKVRLDIHELVSAKNRFRFTYDDQGIWGWGAGIDDFLISKSSTLCGNQLCEPGESPSICPGDCPSLESLPDTWIPENRDLFGQEVIHNNFSGNLYCDDCSQEIALGFDFEFYGEVYKRLFVNSNGNVSFEKDYISYVPQAFCLDGPQMLAPFFSDVDLNKGGKITYYEDPDKHYFLVSWHSVSFFGCESDCDRQNSYQLLITDGSIRQIGNQWLPKNTNVVFSYGDMQWTGGTASAGYRGFGGSPATVGINSGKHNSCTAYGIFDHAGHDFSKSSHPPNCQINGVDHLDYQALFFDAKLGDLTSFLGIVEVAGTANEQGIEVSWEIDCIKEAGYFEIERAGPDKSFELIHVHPLTEEEQEEQKRLFSFQDPVLSPQTYTYRITYIGSEEASHTDSVEVSLMQAPNSLKASSFSIKSFGPNPFTDHIRLQLESDQVQDLHYQLTDMAGRNLRSGKVQVNMSADLNIETNNLPKGIYTLVFRSNLDKQHILLEKN